MRCSEAEEWMNRFLDHDLSEVEERQLFRHLDDCGECAARFEILKLLSDKLSRLPEVAPRYSLVDAIMPRLDAIDKANGQDDSVASAESAAPIMQSVDDRQQGQERGVSRRKNRLWLRVSGGAAAAAILGIVIYQFQPKEIPNAEPPVQGSMSITMESQEPSASADLKRITTVTSSGEEADQQGPSAIPRNTGVVSGSTAPETSLEPQQTPDPYITGAAQDTGTSATNGSAQPAASTPVIPHKAEGKPDKQTSQHSGDQPNQQPDNKQETGDEPAASSPGETMGITSMAATEVEDDTSADLPQDSAPATEPASSDPQASQAPADNDSAGSETNKATKSQVPAKAPKKSDSLSAFKGKILGDQWLSDDSSYLAKLEEGHLIVYDLTSDGHQKIYDDPINGTWKKGAWESRSSVFVYTVVLDGNTTLSKVDAKAAASSLKK